MMNGSRWLMIVALMFGALGRAEPTERNSDAGRESDRYEKKSFYTLLKIPTNADEAAVRVAIDTFVTAQEELLKTEQKTLGSLPPEEQREVLEGMLLDARARHLYDAYNALLQRRHLLRKRSTDLILFSGFRSGLTDGQWENYLDGRAWYNPKRVVGTLFTKFFGTAWEHEVDGKTRVFLKAIEEYYEKSFEATPLFRMKPAYKLFGVDHSSLGHRLRVGCKYMLAAGVAVVGTYYWTTWDQNARLEQMVEERIAAQERPGSDMVKQLDPKVQKQEAAEKKQMDEHGDEMWGKLFDAKPAPTP